MVAFGRADRVTNGYAEAVRAAEAHGFAAVERLAGGRAAVFHEKTLSFSLALPAEDPKVGIEDRFAHISKIMADAFSGIGVDARIGEVPGEYCPGRWSVNVGGQIKVMGVGQRLVRRAVHIGGVVVVDDSHRVRDVLIPVYRALGLDWDPRTTGSLADRSPGVTVPLAAEAIVRELGNSYDLEEGTLDPTLLSTAEKMLEDHLPQPRT